MSYSRTNARKERDAAALTVACPACFSSIGEQCTAPTETGRRHVAWTHYSRQAAAGKTELDEVETGGYMVLREDGSVELLDDMREAEALAVVEHGAVYRITLHRDYRG